MPDTPLQLATPTDLPPEATSAIGDKLVGLAADGLVLYIKTKNFHWHLSGRQFRDLHLMFDEQAAEILASIDPLAERGRQIGRTTLRSIGHTARLQTLQDDDDQLVRR